MGRTSMGQGVEAEEMNWRKGTSQEEEK